MKLWNIIIWKAYLSERRIIEMLSTLKKGELGSREGGLGVKEEWGGRREKGKRVEEASFWGCCYKAIKKRLRPIISLDHGLRNQERGWVIRHEFLDIRMGNGNRNEKIKKMFSANNLKRVIGEMGCSYPFMFLPISLVWIPIMTNLSYIITCLHQ